MGTKSLQFRADTFVWNLELAALDDLHFLRRLVTRRLGHVLDLVDDVVAFQNLAKDDVTAVQPRRLGRRDEELAAVGVLARVCHAELSRLRVLELEVLVGELLAVDGLPARPCSTSAQFLAACLVPERLTVASGKVSALNHEVLDDSVEYAALISIALLASSQKPLKMSVLEGAIGSLIIPKVLGRLDKCKPQLYLVSPGVLPLVRCFHTNPSLHGPMIRHHD